jgi:hypothetical protein
VSDNTPDSAAWAWGILGLGVGSQVERSCIIWSKGVIREQRREQPSFISCSLMSVRESSIMQPRISETRRVLFTFSSLCCNLFCHPIQLFLDSGVISRVQKMSCARRLSHGRMLLGGVRRFGVGRGYAIRSPTDTLKKYK